MKSIAPSSLQLPSSSLSSSSSNFARGFCRQKSKRASSLHAGSGTVVARASVCGVRSRGATLYEVLQLSPEVGMSDIKQAYRHLARKHHPDVCPPNMAEETTRRFIEIQQAYETLSDPRTRALYDYHAAIGGVRPPASSSPTHKAAQPSEWRSKWEVQLSELKFRSNMRAQSKDSWGAQVRRKNGL